MKITAYHDQVDAKNKRRLHELLSELPSFVGLYISSIAQSTESRTRLAYVYDYRIFFSYIHETNPVLKEKDIKDITLEDFSMLVAEDIVEYFNYLQFHEKDGREYTNHNTAIRRKYSSLSSLYHYLYTRQKISQNIMNFVEPPKNIEVDIIRLEPHEVATLIQLVESGDGLTEKQKQYHEKTALRDIAIILIMLGTGIRVSECVGLDITDINFRNTEIHVHRKGGRDDTVYFGDEVESILLEYMEYRKQLQAKPGHENALFLSLQNKRIGVRAVDNLVKKYAQALHVNKPITPHKLRKTYGTALYQETGDIYLTAAALGHKNISTTAKHYSAQSQERKRAARNKVKLRAEKAD